MDYADTESEVLGIGISLIILNGIMYVGLPVFGIIIAKKRWLILVKIKFTIHNQTLKFLIKRPLLTE